jgi:hypothetical protein
MRQQINEEGNGAIIGNSILSIPQIPNTMCGVRAAVQPSLKAFALIYMSHIPVIEGSNFGEEKWILPATDLSRPMYSIRSFIYLFISSRLTKDRVGLH